MEQGPNPREVSGEDVGLNTMTPGYHFDDQNMVMSDFQDDHQDMVMSKSEDDHLNVIDPLDNGLDPAVATAMVATSQCNSVMPLIKLELKTRINLRRPNLTVSSQPTPLPEMTAAELDQREKVRKRNKHHAVMSRKRKKEKETLLKEEIARYEAENGLLEEEIASSRELNKVLKEVLHSHECLQRPKDTPPS